MANMNSTKKVKVNVSVMFVAQNMNEHLRYGIFDYAPLSRTKSLQENKPAVLDEEFIN